MELELWVLYDTDEIKAKELAGIEVKVTEYERRLHTFYTIDNICAYHKKEKILSKVWCSSDVFIVSGSYESLKIKIREAKLKS